LEDVRRVMCKMLNWFEEIKVTSLLLLLLLLLLLSFWDVIIIELTLSTLTICMLFNFSLFLMSIILFLQRYCDIHIVVEDFKMDPHSCAIVI
jgi:hypothetical protein